MLEARVGNEFGPFGGSVGSRSAEPRPPERFILLNGPIAPTRANGDSSLRFRRRLFEQGYVYCLFKPHGAHPWSFEKAEPSKSEQLVLYPKLLH